MATLGSLAVFAPTADARNHGGNGNSGAGSSSSMKSTSSISRNVVSNTGAQGFVAKQPGQHLPKGAQTLSSNLGSAGGIQKLNTQSNLALKSTKLAELSKNRFADHNSKIANLGKKGLVDANRLNTNLKNSAINAKNLGLKDAGKLPIAKLNPTLGGKLGMKAIDPGIGNGKHLHHIDCCPTWNHCHSHCFPWPWFTGCVLGGYWGGYCETPVYCGPICTQPYPVEVPVVVDVDAPVNVTVPVTNVAPTVPAASLADLGLSDLRLVDIGDPSQGLGPMYRLTVRNIGQADPGQFVAAIFASALDQPNDDMVRAGEVVPGLAVDGTIVVDVRLPIESMNMKSADGTLAPFKSVFVVLDARNEVQELNEQNNIIPALREQIRVID